MIRFMRKTARSAQNVDEISLAMERFARASLKLNDFKLAKISREAGGTLKIGEKTFNEAITLMKYGKFDHIVPHIFGIKELSKPLLLKLEREVKHLPQFQLGKQQTKVMRLKKLARMEKTLAKFDEPVKITVADVEANTKMSKLVNYMRGTVYKTLTFGTVIAAVTTPLLIQQINEHRENMTGCIRYEMIDGILRSCKISSRTCKDGKSIIIPSKIECSHSIISSLQPTLPGFSCNNKQNGQCHNCEQLNPNGTDTTDGSLISKNKDNNHGDDDVNDDDATLAQELSDRVYYKCEQPTFLDAIGDITHKATGEVVDFLSDKGRKLNSIFDILLAFAKYSAIVIGTLFIAFIIFYVYSKVKKLDYM